MNIHTNADVSQPANAADWVSMRWTALDADSDPIAAEVAFNEALRLGIAQRYLLRDQPKWTEERLQEALERTVPMQVSVTSIPTPRNGCPNTSTVSPLT